MASRTVRPPPGLAAALRCSPGGRGAPSGGAAARRPRPAATSSASLSSAAAAAPAATTPVDGAPPPTTPRRRPADTDHVVARRAWRAGVHRARVAYAAEASAAAAAVAAARGNEAEVAAVAKRQRDEAKAYVVFSCFFLCGGGAGWVVSALLGRGEDGVWLWVATAAAGTPRGCGCPARRGGRGGSVAPTLFDRPRW